MDSRFLPQIIPLPGMTVFLNEEMEYEERTARVKILIDRGLRIRLMTNLLTGTGHLEVSYLDPEKFPILPIAWEPNNFYIPSAPGELKTIKTALENILYNTIFRGK